MSAVTLKTHPVSKKFEAVNFSTKKYTVRLAQNLQEVEEALRLRYQVFHLEMKSNMNTSHYSDLDKDEFDKYYDHLIIIDNSSGSIIGTYRIQDSAMAETGKGFYSAQEFMVHLLPSEVLLNSVELGRACIHQDYRNGRVLYMMWKGIAKYMSFSKKRFLFGCSSISTTAAHKGWEYYRYLNENGYVATDRLIPVEASHECLQSVTMANEQIELPILFRLYLDIGAKVYSLPAVDHDFGTIDFLIILDIQEIAEETKRLFF